MDRVDGIKTQPHLMVPHFLLKLSLFYQEVYILNLEKLNLNNTYHHL